MCALPAIYPYDIRRALPCEQGDCSLPPLEFETSAFWIDLPLRIKVQLEAAGLNAIACIHAANHAILAMTPLYAQCDITDVDTEHSIADSAISKPFRIMVSLDSGFNQYQRF